MLARLSLFPPWRPARQVVLETGREYLVGRGSDCDLPLEDERISRHHARLSPAESGWRLADLGSKNGTRLDGRPVEGLALLSDGAWISFGGLPAHFEVISEKQRRREAHQVHERWASTWAGQKRLQAEPDLAALPGRLLESILELSGAARGFVLLARPDGELEVTAWRELEPGDLAFPEFSGSVAAVDRVLSTGRAVVLSDARDDSLLGGRPSVVEAGIRALVCLPLSVRGRRLGAVYVDSRRPGTTFTELDVEILEAMAGHAALALAVAGIDLELSGLAARIAAEPGLEGPVRERLRRETEGTWERALLPGGAAVESAGGTTWAALSAPHRAAAGGSP